MKFFNNLSVKKKRILFFFLFLVVWACFLVFAPNTAISFLLSLAGGWQIGGWVSDLIRRFFPD